MAQRIVSYSYPRLGWLILISVLAACGSEGTICRPNCDKAQCGDDGCGGTCGQCDDKLSCTVDRCLKGKCVADADLNYCIINGSCVPSGTQQPDNPCKRCRPSRSTVGWSAEDEGSECGAGAFCYQGDCCNPGVNCGGQECGDNGCGGVCGQCSEFETCREGVCHLVPCDPKCQGKECGPNGCGDVCGTCPNGFLCDEDGRCKCMRLCAGKECGDDGCGGVCGACPGVNVVCRQGLCECAGEECADGCCGPGQVCINEDLCCKPKCDVFECGPDGCGGSCGDCVGSNMACQSGVCVCPGMMCPGGCCLPGQECDLTGNCCTPNCAGKACGPNGCGSLCGLCAPGQLCLTGQCPPEGDVCMDGNETNWDGCTQGQLSEFQVNTHIPEWQYAASVSALAGGRYVVIWDSRGQDVLGEGVYGQIIGVDGQKAGPEFRVNTYQSGDQKVNQVAGFADGSFVAVWQSFEQDGNGWGVYVQVFSADGAKVSQEILANDSPLHNLKVGDQQRPALAALTGGGFAVAWDGMRQTPTGGFLWDDVYLKMYSSVGDLAGPASGIVVNTHTDNEQSHARIAALDDGGFVVVWQSLGQDSDGLGVYFQRFDDAGSPAGAETRVNTYVLGDQRQPRVAGLPSGGFVVVWETTSQDAQGVGIMSRYFDAEGVAVTQEILVNTTTAKDQLAPDVAVFGDGTVVAAWESRDQDGDLSGIFFQRFNSSGVKSGIETRANGYTTSNQRRPAVAILPGNQFVLVWESFGQEGNDSYGIFARRFTKSGEPMYH